MWATREDAWEHWADSTTIPNATLDTLLAAASEQCEEYAPALVHLVDSSLVLGSSVATVFSSDYAFSSKDVGGTVDGSGITLGTTITAVATDGSTATLSAPATATLSLTSLGITRLVPARYTLATVMQAREIYSAGQRDSGDVIGFGDYAIRARPLTAAIKQLLRPQRGRPAVG